MRQLEERFPWMGNTQAHDRLTHDQSVKSVKSIAETHNHPGFFLALFEIIYEDKVRKFYIPTLRNGNPDFGQEINFGYFCVRKRTL